MRHAIGLVLAMTLSGCAARHVPAAAPVKPTSSDWSAVRALPRGAYVLVALDGDSGDARQGVLVDVTDTTLTIRDLYGAVAIPRIQVSRVANRVQTGTRRASKWLGVPITAAVLGGLAAVVAGAVDKNASLKHAGWVSLAAGMAVGVAAGPLDYPRATFTDYVVYVRQTIW